MPGRMPDDAEHVCRRPHPWRQLCLTERAAGIAADAADGHVEAAEAELDQLGDRKTLLRTRVAGGIHLKVEVQVHVPRDFLRRDDGVVPFYSRPLPAAAGLIEQVPAGEEEIVRDHRAAAPADAGDVAGIRVDRREVVVPLHLARRGLMRRDEPGRHAERAVVLLHRL